MSLGVPPEWVLPIDTGKASATTTFPTDQSLDTSLTKALISACVRGSVDIFKQLHDSSEPHMIPPPSYLVRLATMSRWPPMLDHILKVYPLRRLLSFKTKIDTLSYHERMMHVEYSALLAVSQGDLLIVQRLLTAGMPLEPHIEDQYNRVDAFLQHAIDHNQIEMARLLLDRGADPNASVWGTTNRTCVSYAAMLGRHAILNLLLRYGGKIEGSHALWIIATHGCAAENAQTVLELGGNINEIFTYVVGKNERRILGTALHSAAAASGSIRARSIELARLLLQRGIDHTIKDGKGQTALEVAEMRGHTQMKDLIKSWTHNDNLSLHE